MNPQRRSSITDLAEFIVRNYADEPQTVILAQDFIYDSLCRMKFPKGRLLEVGSGQSNSIGLENGGSYHMLRMAAEMLWQLESDGFGARPMSDDLGPGRTWPPLSATVVAHALHVRRVVRQGKLLGLQLAAPPPEAAEGTLSQRSAVVVSESAGMVSARSDRVHSLAAGGPDLGSVGESPSFSEESDLGSPGKGLGLGSRKGAHGFEVVVRWATTFLD